MSAATARILVDYKDHPNDGRYGSVILTGFLIFGAQAALVLVIGFLAARFIIQAIGVPSELLETGTTLLRWLAVTSALTMAFRIYGSILYANKRLDLIHAFHGVNMLFSLVLLGIILSCGGGLLGMGILFVAQAVFATALPILACYKLALLPERGNWGKPALERFHELFSFGKDVFLINVGNQILEASQLIIITRTMGLTAAAAWSVSTKLFGLVYQLVIKIAGTAVVFFAEMITRQEKEKLADRFRQIYQLTAGLAAVTLAVAVAINQSFVTVWASEALSWSIVLSSMLGIFVFLNAVTRCSGDLIIHTKRIGAFRYVYFGEAVVFVPLAIWLSSLWGFYGVLISAILCVTLFRVSYTTWRIADYFDVPVMNLWWLWLQRPIAAIIILLPFVAVSQWLMSAVASGWTQLLLLSIWIGVPATFLLLIVVLPRDVREEFKLRFQTSCSRN